jgi:putative ABC transport system permease protein
MTGPIDIGWVELLGGAALLLVNGLLSLVLGLGLEKRLLVAATRAVVQLTVLGWILVPLFAWRTWWLVLPLTLVMTGLAAWEATRRVDRKVPGILGGAFLGMLVGAGGTAAWATLVLLRPEPLWDPRYLIPLVGMVLGNALTGVSLGLDRALVRLDEGRGEVELLLGLGATRWQAARPVAREALRTGMIPILNAMAAVGLITIPGMMTGQILGGTDPVLAARYQALILFLIAAAVAAGTGIAVAVVLMVALDGEHRLRVDRITRR